MYISYISYALQDHANPVWLPALKGGLEESYPQLLWLLLLFQSLLALWTCLGSLQSFWIIQDF